MKIVFIFLLMCTFVGFIAYGITWIVIDLKFRQKTKKARKNAAKLLKVYAEKGLEIPTGHPVTAEEIAKIIEEKNENHYS